MARKQRPVPEKPPLLTVGALRKIIKDLPDDSVVMCYEVDRGSCGAQSARVDKYLNTNLDLSATIATNRRRRDEGEVVFELKAPLLQITFERPSTES